MTAFSRWVEGKNRWGQNALKHGMRDVERELAPLAKFQRNFLNQDIAD